MLKKILITIIAIITIGFFGYYLWKNVYKSKASTVKATLNFLTSSVEFKQGEIKDINFTLTTENINNYKISGVDLYFKFNLNNNDLLEFVDATASAIVNGQSVNYFDDVIKKEATSSANYGGCKILRFTAVAKKPDSQLVGNINFKLTFKAKNDITGSDSVSLHASTDNIQNQVVGITGSNDNLFDLRVSRDATNYKVTTNAFCDENNRCGANATCQNSSCSCNSGYYNCNGNWNDGCESNVSCSQFTPSSIPTNPPSGNVNLNLKLKFQGVTKKPADQFNSLKVKVTAVSSSGQNKSTEINFVARDIDNNKKGIWEGTASFNLTPGSGYKILIKGPKHIQKKICDASPTETYEGTYSCSDGKITLNAGTNNLDFSNIYLLVGDLPEQNGIVNSYDLALVRNSFGKTDADSLKAADLNLDGKINVQDYALVMAALAVRSDEQ